MTMARGTASASAFQRQHSFNGEGSMPGKDFVNVRLTEFGAKQTGDGTLQVHAGNHSFYFKPGEVKMVTRAFEWERVLKNEHFNGHALFEIAPEAVVPEEVVTEEEQPSTTEGTETTEVR